MTSKLWWDLAVEQELSESHEAMLVFLHRMLSDITVFKVACMGDRVLMAMMADLENRIWATGAVLLLNDSLAAYEAKRSHGADPRDDIGSR